MIIEIADIAAAKNFVDALTKHEVGLVDRARQFAEQPESFLRRFVAGLSIPDDLRECWIWTAGTRVGYGCLYVGKSRKTARSFFVHRAVYILYYGSLDLKLCVCHRCDVTRCANPFHLFAGTKKDNALDMSRKGRSVAQKRPGWARGEKNGRAKLTEAQVKAIRELRTLIGLESMIDILVPLLGISPIQIARIVRGANWR